MMSLYVNVNLTSCNCQLKCQRCEFIELILFAMIIGNYVTSGLNVEEVGGRRESQSPKALSPGDALGYEPLPLRGAIG